MSARCPYEVLEVEPGAPFADVRRAYERIRSIFGPTSLAVYSLVPPEEQRAVLHEIEDAYRILSDPERRASYDREHGHPPAFEGAPAAGPSNGLDPSRAQLEFPALGERNRAEPSPMAWSAPPEPAEPEEEAAKAPVAPAMSPAPVEPADTAFAPVRPDPPAAFAEPIEAEAVEPAPAPSIPRATPPPLPASAVAPAAELPRITEDTVFSGELLQEVRMARNLAIREIAERTKISPTHLESIEKERWDWLPARVFLRGFLVSLARELRLDPEHVSRTYLARRPS